jgi:uncharacterized membrane protein
MTLQTYNWLMIYILGFFCSVLLLSASERYNKHPMAKWSTHDWAGVIKCGPLSFGSVAAVCLFVLPGWVSKKVKSLSMYCTSSLQRIDGSV